MAGRLMELLGNIGTATHQAIVSTSALEAEIQALIPVVETLDEKRDIVEKLAKQEAELAASVVELEAKKTQLEKDIAAVFAKHQG